MSKENDSTYPKITSHNTSIKFIISIQPFLILNIQILQIKMKKLFELQRLINQLPSKFRETYKEPVIAVIGGQSSGKSSLLNSISGHKIFPCGRSVVTTRCPIRLTLTNERQQLSATVGNEKVQVQKVEQKVQALNKNLIDSDQQFSSKPIDIVLNDPKGVNLVVVDLPGLIVNQTSDQQKIKAKLKILDMVKQFIKNQNVIVLSVCKASDDFANDFALSFLKTYSSNFAIPVVTHMDALQIPLMEVYRRLKQYLEDISQDFFFMAYNRTENMPSEQDVINRLYENKLVTQQNKHKLKISTMLNCIVSKNIQIFHNFYQKNRVQLATQLALQIDKCQKKILENRNLFKIIQLYHHKFDKEYGRELLGLAQCCQVREKRSNELAGGIQFRLYINRKLKPQLMRLKICIDEKDLRRYSLNSVGYRSNLTLEEICANYIKQEIQVARSICIQGSNNGKNILIKCLDHVFQRCGIPENIERLFRQEMENFINEQYRISVTKIISYIDMTKSHPNLIDLIYDTEQMQKFAAYLKDEQDEIAVVDYCCQFIRQSFKHTIKRIYQGISEIIYYELVYLTQQKCYEVILNIISDQTKMQRVNQRQGK